MAPGGPEGPFLGAGLADRDPLTAEEVQQHLDRWEGWSGDTSRIAKTFQLDYYTSVKTINEVVEAAQQLQHHPDIDLRWERLRFSTTTYSAGGLVTPPDFKLVAEMERIATAYGATTASNIEQPVRPPRYRTGINGSLRGDGSEDVQAGGPVGGDQGGDQADGG